MQVNRKLKGFEQHGVRFLGDSDSQGRGICPFCGGRDKFFVGIETLLWDCKACGRSGNFEQFLEQRSDHYRQMFRGKVVKGLGVSRGVKPTTLRAWGVGWSGTFYSIPVVGNLKRKTTDVRRYSLGKKCLASTGAHLSFIAPREVHGSGVVWLCEGEWDGMALWECLEWLGIKEDVLCSPGASNLPNKLLEMFRGKDVRVVYDNDDPGMRGAVKVKERLTGIAKKLSFVHWPDGTPDKFDLRDYYAANKKSAKKTHTGITALLKDTPSIPLGMKSEELAKVAQEIELTGAGLMPEEVAKRFSKWLAMQSTECLDVMFGTVLANRMPGDPLWMFIVAPPGGMKTELLMSLREAPKIFATTTLTQNALVSGANFGGGDPSMIPKLDGKVLVIKDFTTILSMNSLARDDIFGTLRDAYDGETRKEFGNGIVRDYKSKFGVLAGVTPIIEGLHATNSQLGERFLKYTLRTKGKIDVGREAIRKALRNIKKNDQMRRELNEAGVEVLKRGTADKDIPDVSDDILERILGLAQWVASLRGVVSREKYTGNVNFKPMAEVGTRLAKQLCKLAYGIGVYKKEKDVSEGTYQTIVTVAQDTAPDRVEEIVKQMFIREPEEYKKTKDIASWSRFPVDTVRYILQDLVLLHIVSINRDQAGEWRLTRKMLKLMLSLKLYKRERLWSGGVLEHAREIRKEKGVKKVRKVHG